MKRVLLIISGILLLVVGLGLREWLVREEISSTQSQLRAQLSEMMNSSTTRERMNEISSSSFVFEKFVQPVFEASNRLLWPGARFDALLNWTRELHELMSKNFTAKKEGLKNQYEKEVSTIREANNPSVDRMIKILKKAEELDADASAAQIAQAEMKSLKEFGQQKDDRLLFVAKEEGNKRLQQLRSLLKKADQKKLGEYLSSGKFVKEIQQPAVELILSIRQEDLRRQAWAEFHTSLNSILAKRSIQLKNAAREKKAKEIERLFQEPMAQIFEQPENPLAELPAVPAPASPMNSPSSATAPHEQDLYNEPELTSPSDASSPN